MSFAYGKRKKSVGHLHPTGSCGSLQNYLGRPVCSSIMAPLLLKQNSVRQIANSWVIWLDWPVRYSSNNHA